MLIVGELINASRKQIKELIDNQDAEGIKKIAKDQADMGADYIDVNAGTYVGEELEYIKWLISNVQEAVDVPCCIDSPDPKVVESAMAVHQGVPMVNSISLEKDRFNALLPVVVENDCKVVALCMGDEGMPESAEDRFAIAEKLVNALVQKGCSAEDIYVDPLVQPVSTNAEYGWEFLRAISRIRNELSGVHTVCGLSNISFGLPRRPFLNRTFMAMAITMGLDGAIVNPLDKSMMATIYAAEALAGRDEYCMNYLTAYREGLFEG
jgi:5-methyltetrahydrofolate--homocysteine methyltransferase